MLEITHISQTRKNFIDLIQSLSLEEINRIPNNFSNNIAWNFGHIVVTQQILCYKLSGLEMYVSDEMIEKYKKGSRPNGDISQEELDELISISDKNLELLEADLEALKFINYTEYATSYNVTLTSIRSAIKFNSVHEGLHYGYALALRKCL